MGGGAGVAQRAGPVFLQAPGSTDGVEGGGVEICRQGENAGARIIEEPDDVGVALMSPDTSRPP